MNENESKVKNFIILIGLIASLVTLITFFTGKQSLSSFFKGDDIEFVENEPVKTKIQNKKVHKNGNFFYKYYVWNHYNWWRVLIFLIITNAITFVAIGYEVSFINEFSDIYIPISTIILTWTIIFAIISIFWL